MPDNNTKKFIKGIVAVLILLLFIAFRESNLRIPDGLRLAGNAPDSGQGATIGPVEQTEADRLEILKYRCDHVRDTKVSDLTSNDLSLLRACKSLGF